MAYNKMRMANVVPAWGRNECYDRKRTVSLCVITSQVKTAVHFVAVLTEVKWIKCFKRLEATFRLTPQWIVWVHYISSDSHYRGKKRRQSNSPVLRVVIYHGRGAIMRWPTGTATSMERENLYLFNDWDCYIDRGLYGRKKESYARCDISQFISWFKVVQWYCPCLLVPKPFCRWLAAYRAPNANMRIPTPFNRSLCLRTFTCHSIHLIPHALAIQNVTPFSWRSRFTVLYP